MKYFLSENEQQALSLLKKNNIPVNDKNFIKLKNQVEKEGLKNLLGFFTILFFKYQNDLVWIEDIIHILKPLILKKQLSLIKGYNGDFNSLLSEDLLENLKEADIKSDGMWVIKRLRNVDLNKIIGEENKDKLIIAAGKAYKLNQQIEKDITPYIKRIENNPSKEQIDNLYKFLLAQLDDKSKIQEKYINKMISLRKENIGSLIYYKNNYAVFWCFNEKAVQELADITTYCSKSNSNFLTYENLQEGGNFYLFFNFNEDTKNEYFVMRVTINPQLNILSAVDKDNKNITDINIDNNHMNWLEDDYLLEENLKDNYISLKDFLIKTKYPSDILDKIKKYYKTNIYKNKNEEKLYNTKSLEINYNNLHLLNNLHKFPNLESLFIYENNDLISLPESIGNLTNLKALHIYDNDNLTSISESIGNLTNLKELYLGNNKSTYIPESIGKLTNLELLNISVNNLTSLPNSIENLTNLEELNINDNNLTSLPESIGNLANLEKLYISSNNLTSIPNSIGNLTNLEKLDISYNNLTSIPNSIGNLINLKKLLMNDNKILSIPESIGYLKKLSTLNINRNPITSLPDSIKKFYNNLNDFKSKHRTIGKQYLDNYTNNTFEDDMII